MRSRPVVSADYLSRVRYFRFSISDISEIRGRTVRRGVALSFTAWYAGGRGG